MSADARIRSRPSRDNRDLIRMYELAAALPGDALHGADLPWRLSSPSAGMPERTRLWEDASGALVAWAVLQFPWHCLDVEARSVELEGAASSGRASAWRARPRAAADTCPSM